jgi:hypothetical protein
MRLAVQIPVLLAIVVLLNVMQLMGKSIKCLKKVPKMPEKSPENA